MRVLIGIALAWAAAWAVVILNSPSLAVVAGLGFLQNLAFMFVSRGRNSGSLVYHMVASVFSNGIWVTMFVIGIKITTAPDADIVPFAVVYCLSTMAGSVFAHWLAKKVERGKARNVQEDRVKEIEDDLFVLANRLGNQESALMLGADQTNERLGDIEGRLRLIDDELDRKHTLITEERELRARQESILRDAIRQNNEKIDALENHIPDLDAAHGKIAGLERQVNLLDKVVVDQVASARVLNEECAILRRQIEAGNDRFGKLEERMDDCITGIMRNLAPTFADIDKLTCRVLAVEKGVSTQSFALADLRQKIENLQRAIQPFDENDERATPEELRKIGLVAGKTTWFDLGLTPEDVSKRLKALEEDRGRAFQRLENHLVAIDGLRQRIAGSKTVAGVDGARINVLNRSIDSLRGEIEEWKRELKNLESLTLDRIDALEKRAVSITLPVMKEGEIVGYYTTDPGDTTEFEAASPFLQRLKKAEERLDDLSEKIDIGNDTIVKEMRDLHAAFEKEVRREEEDIRRLDWLTKKVYAGEAGSTPFLKDVLRELETDLGNLEDRVKELEEK